MASRSIASKNPECLALGERFKAVRRSKGVTLIEMCERIGHTVNVLRAHEAGGRMLRLDEIVIAARFLEVPLSDLCEVK